MTEVCGASGQARRVTGELEVYVCWREPKHEGSHHGPLMGRIPGPEEAFMTWSVERRGLARNGARLRAWWRNRGPDRGPDADPTPTTKPDPSVDRAGKG